MQVSVEKTSDLSRKMTVHIPEEVFQEKLEARLKSLAKDIKLDGFRPGKVPKHVVKKMFGSRVRSEVAGDLIQSSYYEALQEQEQVPVGPPSIIPSETPVEGHGLEYTAEFEVYPTVSLSDIDQIEVGRPIAEIREKDIDAMVQKLREQKKEWHGVDRVAADQDKVIIKFSGVSEGESFTDGEVDNFPVIIGSNQMISGFEDSLIGLGANSKKTVELVFPEDYGNEKLQGKPAVFEIEVDRIEEAELPEINEDFIKGYGIESGELEAFHKDITANMQRELDQAVRGNLKNAVMDGLIDKIELTLPKTMIDQEIENLIKPYRENAQKQNSKADDQEIPREKFEKQAVRRVSLGLILAEIIKQNEIKAEGARVRATIEEMAQSYEHPDDVVNWYYADKSRLAEVEQMVLEDGAVDWLLGKMKVIDKAVDFEEIMDQRQ